MNHLEQLVAEWLQYRKYFVRMSVLVGPRERGGFEGELDVVGFNPISRHFVHVECSLDALAWQKRETKFRIKFERGKRFCPELFRGLPTPTHLDQIAVIQVPNVNRREIGEGRLITVRELIHEIYVGLEGTNPLKGAVPSNLPLLRTLQLAADAGEVKVGAHRLIPEMI